VTELLLEAGCAVNELTASDYGFDIHVLLPARFPGEATRWPMSADSVLVQVKGGRTFSSGVSLTREMWRFYLRSPVPVYLAVVPSKGAPWIELVDRLAQDLEARESSEGADEAKTKIRRQPNEDPRWSPQLFVEDAILHARLGSRRRRAQVLEWARWRGGSDPELDFLLTLGELAAAETGDYTQIDEQVASYLAALPGLVERLQEEGVIGGISDAPDVSFLELAAQIVDGEFLDGAGALEPPASELHDLLHEFAGIISSRDLVLLANREHYFAGEYFANRDAGLGSSV